MHPSLFSQFDLTGKAAIVTGASRGLGVSFARGLAKAGCDLIIAARDMDKLRDVARDLEQYGRSVVPVQADVPSHHVTATDREKPVGNVS